MIYLSMLSSRLAEGKRTELQYLSGESRVAYSRLTYSRLTYCHLAHSRSTYSRYAYFSPMPVLLFPDSSVPVSLNTQLTLLLVY